MLLIIVWNFFHNYFWPRPCPLPPEIGLGLGVIALASASASRFWPRLTSLCNKNLSHAHTVVWECCNNYRQSQWEMAKFDPQPTLNAWTDRHQIWNTWLGRGYILPKNLGVNPPRGFCPHMSEIAQNFRMFTALFQFFWAPTDEPVGPIFAFNTTYDVVLRRVVPFGVRKFKFNI